MYSRLINSSIIKVKVWRSIGWNFGNKGNWWWYGWCFVTWTLQEYLLDNMIQHETSHNFGVDDSSNNIMDNSFIWPDIAMTFLQHNDWVTWNSGGAEKLYNEQLSFNQVPL